MIEWSKFGLNWPGAGRIIGGCLLAAGLGVLSGCSSGPQVEIPEEIAALENLTVLTIDERQEREIDLVEEAMFGDGEEVFIRSIGFMTVDDRGRVFLTDPSQRQIHVFGPDERLVKSLGGEGEGPGEFRNLFEVWVSEGYLHAYDSMQQSMTLFDLDALAYVRRYDLSVTEGGEGDQPSGRPVRFHVQENGNYWVQIFPFSSNFEEYLEMRTHHISVYDRENGRYSLHGGIPHDRGELIVSRVGGGMSIVTAPYQRRNLFTTLDGELVHGWTNDLLLRFYDTEGVYRRALYYPYQKSRLNRQDVRVLVEDHSEQVRDIILGYSDMPDEWPAFMHLVGDDEGRLWIATIGENPERYIWWVINREGERIAQFDWPRTREIMAVRNGKAYARVMETLGESYIVRYRIDMEG